MVVQPLGLESQNTCEDSRSQNGIELTHLAQGHLPIGSALDWPAVGLSGCHRNALTVRYVTVPWQLRRVT
jgi:hypothetical protein